MPSHALIVPDEVRHRLGRYFQLLGHDLLFPEWILANPLPCCSDSGLCLHTFQVS